MRLAELIGRQEEVSSVYQVDSRQNSSNLVENELSRPVSELFRGIRQSSMRRIKPGEPRSGKRSLGPYGVGITLESLAKLWVAVS